MNLSILSSCGRMDCASNQCSRGSDRGGCAGQVRWVWGYQKSSSQLGQTNWLRQGPLNRALLLLKLYSIYVVLLRDTPLWNTRPWGTPRLRSTAWTIHSSLNKRSCAIMRLSDLHLLVPKKVGVGGVVALVRRGGIRKNQTIGQMPPFSEKHLSKSRL